MNRGRETTGQASRVWEDVLKQSELRRFLSFPAEGEEGRRRLMLWRLFGEPEDTAYLFFFDRRFFCIKTLCVCRRGIRLRDSYRDTVVCEMKENGAVYFAAAHNHVNEPLIPSPDDLKLTYTMLRCAQEELWGKGAFLGHYITDGFASVKIEL